MSKPSVAATQPTGLSAALRWADMEDSETNSPPLVLSLHDMLFTWRPRTCTEPLQQHLVDTLQQHPVKTQPRAGISSQPYSTWLLMPRPTPQLPSATFALCHVVPVPTPSPLALKCEDFTRVTPLPVVGTPEASAELCLLRASNSESRAGQDGRVAIAEKRNSKRVVIPISTCLNDDANDFQTTIMITGIPIDCTREMVHAAIDAEGFEGLYDFLYVPHGLGGLLPMGYALVNFKHHLCAKQAMGVFHGGVRWSKIGGGACSAKWSRSTFKGLASRIGRYRRKSPMVSKSVSDRSTTALFKRGARLDFRRSSMRRTRSEL